MRVHRSWLKVRPAERFLDKALYEASFAAFAAAGTRTGSPGGGRRLRGSLAGGRGARSARDPRQTARSCGCRTSSARPHEPSRTLLAQHSASQACSSATRPGEPTGRRLQPRPDTPAAWLLLPSGGALVVPPERPDLLSEATIRLRDDPQLRRTLGFAGRAYAIAHLDRERLLTRLEQVIQG